MSHDAGIGSEIGSTDGDATAPVVAQEYQEPQSAAEQVAMNPKWDTLLSKVPAQLHPMMAPTLHEWDTNYQDLATKFSPYKDFAENGVDAESIQQALGLMQYSTENPRAIFDALVQNFPEFVEGLGQAQTPVGNQQVVDDGQMDLGNPFENMDIANHPKFQELQGNMDLLAGYLSSQVTQQEEAQASAALDVELETLGQKYGAFDEQYVFGLAVTGVPLETAVQRYKQMEQNIRSQPAPGHNFPPVMTPGGGMPSSALDVTKLDDKSTRGLALQFLKNSKES